MRPIPAARTRGSLQISPRSLLRPESRLASGQNVQALFKPVRVERFLPLAVVVGIIRVQPVAAAVDVEIGDLGEFRGLDQKLLLRKQGRDQADFSVVQVKLTAVQLLVHVRVRKKDFRRAALDNDIEQLGAPELVERLRGEGHRSVVLPPGLKSFGDEALTAGVPKKYPSLVDEEGFEGRRDFAAGDDLIGAVQDVEQQRFEQFRIAAHLLEIEALETRKRDGVLWVVEEKSELSSTHPFG